MDANEIKESLDTEQIIQLCCKLQGTDDVLYDAYGHPIFYSYLDHEGADSQKLYYFPESKLFFCFTGNGDSYDVFELVKRALKCDFKEAHDYIVNFFGLKDRGFKPEKNYELTSDWDIFQKVQDFQEKNNDKVVLPSSIQENLLQFFYPLAAPTEWQREGISPEVMYHYGIRVDCALEKIIIPHRNKNGELIGIRGRSYNPLEIEDGKKYMPVFIEGSIFAHSLGKNLFGLYENQETIKKIKKVLIVEAEKSVLQLGSFYGVDNCWAVAVCGSNLSSTQISMLLELEPNEVILAMDREFEGGKGDADTIEYEAKLLKIVTPLLPYVNVSIIMDYNHLTGYKDSPTDCGKETFEELFHQRVKLYTLNNIEKSKKRRV